eukprot:1156805-Pelagomonas_calceolata.AAC.3
MRAWHRLSWPIPGRIPLGDNACLASTNLVLRWGQCYMSRGLALGGVLHVKRSNRSALRKEKKKENYEAVNTPYIN